MGTHICKSIGNKELNQLIEQKLNNNENDLIREIITSLMKRLRKLEKMTNEDHSLVKYVPVIQFYSIDHTLVKSSLIESEINYIPAIINLELPVKIGVNINIITSNFFTDKNLERNISCEFIANVKTSMIVDFAPRVLI